MDTQSTSRKALKSPQEQEDQRQRRNEGERARRVAETAQQKSERVRKRKERSRARRAAQTASDRQATLQRKSTCEREIQQMRDRVAAETLEEMETRLQRMWDRVAAETPEETEVRLQRMRDRVAAETPEETEAKLQWRRDRLAAETLKRGKQSYSRWVLISTKGWQLKLLWREKQDCNATVQGTGAAAAPTVSTVFC